MHPSIPVILHEGHHADLVNPERILDPAEQQNDHHHEDKDTHQKGTQHPDADRTKIGKPGDGWPVRNLPATTLDRQDTLGCTLLRTVVAIMGNGHRLAPGTILLQFDIAV